MDAITRLPANLPPHRHAPLSPVPHRIVAQWPAGTFVENLAVLDDGSIAVSLLSEARIDRVQPDGRVSTLLQLQAPVTGLALLDGVLYAAVGEPGRAPATIWAIDPASGRGAPHLLIEGASFLNGLTAFDAHHLLVADSLSGALILIDVRQRRSRTWFSDITLQPAPGIEMLPGANGVKRFGSDVTVSSNSRALLLRVGIEKDGSAGALTTLSSALRADDFAFDTRGRLYLATHLGHSVDRLDSDGIRIAIAGPAQGAAGSTACAFGRSVADATALYVTTTGGILDPVDGQLQPAKLLRLEVASTGHPLDPANGAGAQP